MSSAYEVAIVGAGFSGLGMAIQLKKSGFDSFVVLERASDVGGIWRDNVYPGCACDIPSILYSFSFEPNAHWSRVYPQQDEIWNYLRACARKYRLREHLRLGADVAEARFDETEGAWHLRLAGGETIAARVLVLATGALNQPVVPAFEGVERFAGKAFHSSQWDRSADLRGLRVAVIGSGASAVQIVPEIAPSVARLDVYQRTPPWILPRMDRAVGARARAALRRIPGLAWAARALTYWSHEARAYPLVRKPDAMRLGERMARAHLERQVADPEMRRKLTPHYRMGCKRVLLSDDYYTSLVRDNVELVTSPIAEFRERSIVAQDGIERPTDVVVFATGFAATDALGSLRVAGRGGRELRDAWREGMHAYLGSSIAGFPNLFTIVGPNTGLGHNSMVVMMEAQYRYVLSALREMRRRGLRWLDVRPEVEQRFNERLARRLQGTVWNSGCRSWYLDKNGKNTTLWPGFTFTYRALTRRLKAGHYELMR